MNKKRPKTSPELRQKVKERDDYRCRACGSPENLTVHHRLPPRLGGTNDIANLVTLCEFCHHRVHAGGE